MTMLYPSVSADEMFANIRFHSMWISQSCEIIAFYIQVQIASNVREGSNNM